VATLLGLAEAPRGAPGVVTPATAQAAYGLRLGGECRSYEAACLIRS
jgi:hypothetical protein